MKSTPFYAKQYREEFSRNASAGVNSIRATALGHALDIRKFEIDLYWRRASYFWAFIGAALAGYVAIQAADPPGKAGPSVLLSCLGLVFSFAWFLANRGSKYWQENWENHVDMLEDDVTGPLYKVVLSRKRPEGFGAVLEHGLTGPSAFSVSKINQLLSLFVTVIWIVLIFASLPPFSIKASISWVYTSEVASAVLACAALCFFGRTHQGDYHHQGTLRHVSMDSAVDDGEKGTEVINSVIAKGS